MTRHLLIDTDILIDYVRGFEKSRHFLISISKDFVLYISVVAIAELYSGKDTKNLTKAKEIEKFLSNFEIAVVSPKIAKQAGELRRDHNRPFADMLVAATALEYDFVLATRNMKHFRGLKGLEILKPY